jgi:hypothetical protein
LFFCASKLIQNKLERLRTISRLSQIPIRSLVARKFWKILIEFVSLSLLLGHQYLSLYTG